ncbi:hypothetical protein [Paenibacillus sp. UNC499MF]|uniref:hypothetical protein n=1 Tax=Paenibacillus sp. UNC499MF TaxID=1502751 RepID=UPI0008A08C28|nr:hypothetical protein [Paenibacillus sp. UNC499MF]SEG45276.1 hypothetical protein SAMN02799616_03035 [Paenibacillus sp. UNC499MF]
MRYIVLTFEMVATVYFTQHLIKKIINELWSQLSSVSYVSGSSADTSGGSTLRIFDKNNQEIGNLIHYETVYIRVNEKEYKAIKSVDLKNVYEAIITEQNKVNE